MPARRLLHFDIAGRRLHVDGMVAPDDLALTLRATACPFPESALAYCADMLSERVLFTLHGSDIKTLFNAPFLYAPQLRGAQHAVTVPFERVADFDPATPNHPTLIFSPGRAGSTLLASLLNGIGAACASEPDMLTQICRLNRLDRQRLGPVMEVALLRACLTALCRVLGPAPFVKLRSQCNARPLPLLDAAGGTAILLMRQLYPWARSRHRAFREPPASVAAVLRQCLDAADKLFASPAPAQLLWFEDLSRDPAATLRACLPDRAFEAETIARIMLADSQAGTSIARSVLSAAAPDADFDAAFDQAWHTARRGAEWSARTLAMLAAMQPDGWPAPAG